MRAERLGDAALDVPALAETDLAAVIAALEAEGARGLRRRLGTDHALRRADQRRRLGRAGARGDRLADGGREADRHGADPGRARDQGGLGRGPACARAPGRLRADLRGRARAQLPDTAGAEESLRRDQRGRRLRDALRRAGRGRGPLGALRRRGHARPPARSCSARWRAPARCWSRSRRWSRRPRSCRRAGSPTGSTATGWRWCWRCSRRHAGVSVGGADVFVNVAGGVRVDEPGADLAVALAISSAKSGKPLTDAGGRPLACFGEVGLTGELRHVGHPERRLAEAVKFGLAPVIGPRSSERLEGLSPAETLRAALAQARSGAARSDAARAPAAIADAA